MAQRSPGEPIGCVALLVGAAALTGVLATSSQGRRLVGSVVPGLAAPATGSSATPSELTAQRKALDLEAEMLRSETRRLRDERTSGRKERMLAIAARLSDGERRLYHRLRLRNTCRYTVAVALHYRDLDESWVTRGWWELAPGASTTTDAMTREAVFYLYAENQAVGRTWEGKAEKGALSLTISDERFDQLEGEPFLSAAPRTASFRKREAGPQWTDPLESFECPVEETPPPGTTAGPPSAEQGPRRP
jgi:uncharacterized membrane protein